MSLNTAWGTRRIENIPASERADIAHTVRTLQLITDTFTQNAAPPPDYVSESFYKAAGEVCLALAAAGVSMAGTADTLRTFPNKNNQGETV